MAKDLKLKATLDNQVSAQVDKMIADLNRLGNAQKTGMVQVEQKAKVHQDNLQKIQRQASIEEAKLVVNKFDRQIAVQKVKHGQILQDLRGNQAAVEAETKRHNAILQRIEMDKGNFSNTPFQKMLGNLNALDGKLNRLGPSLSLMTRSMGAAGIASTALGQAFSGLALGPLAIVMTGLTGVNLLVNKLISKQEEVVARMQAMPKNMQDPEKLKAMIDALNRYDNARPGRLKVGDQNKASADFKAQTGESIEAYRGRGGADPAQQLVAMNKIIEHKKKNSDDLLALTKEAAAAEASLEQDEFKRKRMMEDLDYQDRVRKAKGNALELEQLARLHKANLRQIARDEEVKALDDELRASEIRSKQLIEKNRREAEAKKQEKDAEFQSDILRTEKFYAKQAEALQKEKETARARKELDRQVFQNKRQLTASGAQLLKTLAGQSKAAFLIEQSSAAASIIMDMMQARAAATAASPLTFGEPFAGYATVQGAIGLATVLAQTVKGFQHGTDYHTGGLARINELGPETVILPKGSKVIPASQSAASMPAPTINVHVNGNADSGTVRAIGRVVSDELRHFADTYKKAQYGGYL